jgi:DNA-binding LacI/PurR family transcriptional regulator
VSLPFTSGQTRPNATSASSTTLGQLVSDCSSASAIWECPHDTHEEGKRAAESLFKERPRPSVFQTTAFISQFAILAGSACLALGVIEAACKERIRIPKDLSVVALMILQL